MKKLVLLKFDDLYKNECMLLAHDCVHGNAPVNIKSSLQLANNNEHNLRNQSENPLDLRLPNMKTRAGNSSFSLKGPQFWNSVSTELRNIERKTTFKNAIKRATLYEYERKASCSNPQCRDHCNHSQSA